MKVSVGLRRALSLVLVVLIAVTVAVAGSFGVVPAQASPGAQVLSLTHLRDALWRVVVRSTSMGADIPFYVLRPKSEMAGAPTLYLLNGAGGGEDGANWLAQTDAEKFFAEKKVNVVIPEKGRGTYYTDWQRNDPKVGKPQWETFLTRELPPVLDTALTSSGRNAIAGLSMSGTSVLNLAIAAPELYGAVASYSGCALTSTPEGEAAVRGIVYTAAGADATNMWGPSGSPAWAANDPYVHAAELRGTRVYLSSGSGLPGRYDTPEGQAPGSPPLYDQILVGGALEKATRYCTERMTARLRELGIPAQSHLPPTGTHSWNYWRDELKRSWPMLAAGLR
ncbi:MAG: alpha/beta hydrolase family protein [Gordonia sp. (in: high G+C Gram-positive bacteria)]|uniref:alpha/beta hydrolase n=1 Tax=Gordonia sp. (in: high G+C Gram-positive bacteria) TaxID=84139 RepID=UPI0039E54730